MRGAHCDPKERPSGMSVLGDTSSGWVPSAQMTSNLKMDFLSEAFDAFTKEMQEENTPPAPRASPDFFELMNDANPQRYFFHYLMLTISPQAHTEGFYSAGDLQSLFQMFPNMCA